MPADTHSTNETNEYKTVGFFSSSRSSCPSVCFGFLFFSLEKADVYRDEKGEEDQNRP